MHNSRSGVVTAELQRGHEGLQSGTSDHLGGRSGAGEESREEQMCRAYMLSTDVKLDTEGASQYPPPSPWATAVA